MSVPFPNMVTKKSISKAGTPVLSPGARPVIYDFKEPLAYVRAMLAWHKTSQEHFSIRQETSKLRRCSPALVTQIIQGKRRLTLDRLDDFAKLLKLSSEEKSFLSRWIDCDQEAPSETKNSEGSQSSRRALRPQRFRRENQNHLLKDWINVYVKDSCRLKGFKPEAQTIHRLLGGIAPVKRIEKSLDFLLKEGFLRRTLDGRVVENDVLVTTTDEIPDKHIQIFHQNALAIARRGLAQFPLAKRRESSLTLPLNEKSIGELKELLKDFYARLLAFAETHTDDDEQLYQVIINLTPVGGSSHVVEK